MPESHRLTWRALLIPSPWRALVWGLTCLSSQPRLATRENRLASSPGNPLSSRGRTFQSTSSGAAYVGGICSMSRGGGVNEVSWVGSWLGLGVGGRGLRRA